LVSIKELTGGTNTPIIIVQEPEGSKVTNNGDGTLTIIFDKNDSDRFVAPALVILYKDSTGDLKEAKKEFVVTQDGDVPSLVQTGADTNPNDSTTPAGRIALLFALMIIAVFIRSSRRERI
jgi:hypothetical protein